MNTPAWVNDNPLIIRLLSSYLDKREREVRLSIRVNEKNTPELFNFDHDTDALWALITHKLAQEHAMLRVQLKRNNTITAQDYQGAMLYFDTSDKTEDKIRHWLNRPKVRSYFLQWQQALEQSVVENSTALIDEIKHAHKTAHCIISGFNHVQKELETLKENRECISLRCLSARCFWGDSKFLDEKRNLLYAIFPSYSHCIEARPIMMSAYIPEQLNAAIFVENFDSFCALSNIFMTIDKANVTRHTAIIYSAGFKSSAERIRTLGNSQFVTINTPSSESYQLFNDWWFKTQTQSVNCFFWGDLDYSAMTILRSLRNNFPTIRAWQAGYKLILQYHLGGLGHRLIEAKKQNQRDPISTGCDYADQQLLPLMRESQRFIDQEIVGKTELSNIFILNETL